MLRFRVKFLTLVIRNSVRSIKLDSLVSADIDLVPPEVLAEVRGEVVEELFAEEPEDPLVALGTFKHRRSRA